MSIQSVVKKTKNDFSNAQLDFIESYLANLHLKTKNRKEININDIDSMLDACSCPKSSIIRNLIKEATIYALDKCKKEEDGNLIIYNSNCVNHHMLQYINSNIARCKNQMKEKTTEVQDAYTNLKNVTTILGIFIGISIIVVIAAVIVRK